MTGSEPAFVRRVGFWMLVATLIATIEELHAHLGDAKRTLISLCETLETDSEDLRELASSAVLAEEIMGDLGRSVRMRCNGKPIRLSAHEVQAIETAFMVNRSIDLALKRVVQANYGACAIH